jgi:hypothetical protein
MLDRICEPKTIQTAKSIPPLLSLNIPHFVVYVKLRLCKVPRKLTDLLTTRELCKLASLLITLAFYWSSHSTYVTSRQQKTLAGVNLLGVVLVLLRNSVKQTSSCHLLLSVLHPCHQHHQECCQ